MNKPNYEQSVTFNYASSLGAAFRNALTPDLAGRFNDHETAGNRLTELLKRMQDLGQFESETVVGVLVSMMSQMGELGGVADYCAENNCSNIEAAERVYIKYAKALKAQDLDTAKRHATIYNFYLKQAGGPEKHRTESYLSMGEVA